MTYEKYSLGKLKAISTGTTYVKPPKGVQSDKKAVNTAIAFGGHAGNSTTHPDGKKVSLKFTAEEIELGEAKNHMGETEYTSYASWKKAAKKVNADVWFDGDDEIGSAMVGPKPFKKGETKGIGEWDGEVGTIYAKVSEGKELVNRARALAGLPILKEGEEKDKVYSRVASYAKGEISAEDQKRMKRDIASKMKAGWTASEIVSYMKNMEEVNPEQDEDKALARMKVVSDAVAARLAKAK